jgi:hypothetical protein
MEHGLLEGTWEEIAQHAGEFAGKRIRVTVLEQAASPDPNRAMLAFLDQLREKADRMPAGGRTDESLAMLREGREGKMFRSLDRPVRS